MNFREKPLQAVFVKRMNRFAVLVKIEKNEVMAHLPNSGRLGELLVPGRRCYVLPARNSLRKTAFDLMLIETPNGLLTSTDARLPNQLFEEAFHSGVLTAFKAYTTIRREVKVDNSRLDFLLSHSGQLCYVEVKSVTLVDDDTALFPDAPTVRGVRHLRELMDLKEAGHDAAVVFWVQREDAKRVKAHEKSDPLFAQTLRHCVEKGVQILAYKSRVSERGMLFMGRVAVEID